MAVPNGTSHPPNLPAFLRQSKADLHNTYTDLEWAQRERLLAGSQAPITTPPTAETAPQPSQWAPLRNEGTAARNRYANVEPYAQNRVKLAVPSGLNDYINASPIVLGERRYIATQGPKDTSVAHFYRMLEQETGEARPAVVVMLTQTHEGGREKCFQYYPLVREESPMVLEPDAEDEVQGDWWRGSVELEGVEMDGSTRSEVRRLRLRTKARSKDGGGEEVVREKAIHHLLFSGWPDFLVPEGEDREALVRLIALSAQLNCQPATTAESSTSTNGGASAFISDQSTPRIIHCSAGVGRSGTFIALDYLLHLLHTGQLDHLPESGEGSDPVAETVDAMRKQRMMMVQGEGQFMFVYEVLREEWAKRAEGLGQAVGGADGR